MKFWVSPVLWPGWSWSWPTFVVGRRGVVGKTIASQLDGVGSIPTSQINLKKQKFKNLNQIPSSIVLQDE